MMRIKSYFKRSNIINSYNPIRQAKVYNSIGEMKFPHIIFAAKFLETQIVTSSLYVYQTLARYCHTFLKLFLYVSIMSPLSVCNAALLSYMLLNDQNKEDVLVMAKLSCPKLLYH